MRMLLSASALAVTLSLAPAAPALSQTSRASDSLERPFATGGRIHLDLSAGEYRIQGSPDNRIRLEWSVRNTEQLRSVRAKADVRGSEAWVNLDGPDHSGFRVTVYVPRRSDLDVDLSAGEIRIEGIEGNKDVSLYAGEMHIDVGRAEDYRRVEASIWAGEIQAAPFRASKEGLFRSFDWNGTGPYRLHASLWAGEVRLYDNSADRPR
jgi:hypothetical protein